MQTRIKLLPKIVINQIAAGEVIQRPSSIVKELIDNSIDAKSKNIHLIIKDSGKTHIQINDDGEGMNKKEMSICFERHTTSKIKNTEDIFHINTLGFRGEALSSIASVSKLIIKSKSKSHFFSNTLANLELSFFFLFSIILHLVDRLKPFTFNHKAAKQ